jgi:hypothetical protein
MLDALNMSGVPAPLTRCVHVSAYRLLCLVAWTDLPSHDCSEVPSPD